MFRFSCDGRPRVLLISLQRASWPRMPSGALARAGEAPQVLHAGRPPKHTASLFRRGFCQAETKKEVFPAFLDRTMQSNQDAKATQLLSDSWGLPPSEGCSSAPRRRRGPPRGSAAPSCLLMTWFFFFLF